MSIFSKITESLKDLIGVENDFFTSAQEVVNERVNSPFYGYFLLGWLFINWKIPYSLFFLDQKIIFDSKDLLRHEYVLQGFFPKSIGAILLLNFILPFTLSIIFVFFVPWATSFIYKRFLLNKKRLERIKFNVDNKALKQKNVDLKEESSLVQENKKIEEDLWSEDFNLFVSNQKNIDQFTNILEIIFKHSGNLYRRATKSMASHFTPIVDESDFEDFIIGLEINGVLRFNKSNFPQSRSISLTKKGDFFVKEFNKKFKVFGN